MELTSGVGKANFANVKHIHILGMYVGAMLETSFYNYICQKGLAMIVYFVDL